MRTAIVMGPGFLPWAICLGVARLVGGAAAALPGTVAFLLLWSLAAGVNLWAGMYRAGCSPGEELPIPVDRRGTGRGGRLGQVPLAECALRPSVRSLAA